MAVAFRLSAFRAQHFKPFVDTSWLSIRPVTLLFGHNSSGKSAALSILPMLRQSIDDPNLSTPLVLSSDTGVDLGTYEEVAYRHEVSLQTPIRFGLEFSFTAGESDGVFTPRLAGALSDLSLPRRPIHVSFAASYNKKRRRIAITEFTVSQPDSEPLLRLYRKTTAATQRWHVEPESLSPRETSILWRHFIPRAIPSFKRSGNEPLTELINAISQTLHGDLRNLVHVGPLRAFPQRAYRLTGESPRDVGELGQNWLSLLLQARARESLTRDVNTWLRRMDYTMHIEWGRQGYVHPVLTDPSGLQIGLKDVGFGISQILPLLIQGLSSPPGTILILEQPEIHLHPRAQAELAEVLLAIANRGIRLLIETHSEHLLLRLQRRIAETVLGEAPIPLRPADIAVYFFHRGDEGSRVHMVALDEEGQFVEPPPQFETFFSQDYEEAVEWTRASARIAVEKDNATSD